MNWVGSDISKTNAAEDLCREKSMLKKGEGELVSHSSIMIVERNFRHQTKSS